MNFIQKTNSAWIVKWIWIIWILTWISAVSFAALEPLPKPIHYTSDFANVLTGQEENQINVLADVLKKKTQVQLAVVTMDSALARGYSSIEEAAVSLFSQWGIGEKGKDNGLLILVAVKDRKWRVEVGYGLEGTIPDVVASRLGRTLLPDAFRAGRYGQGLYDLSVALIAEIARERNIPLNEFNINVKNFQQSTRSESSGHRQSGSVVGGIFSAVMAILVLLFFLRHPNLFILMMLLSGNRRNDHWSGGSHFGGGFGGGGGSFGGGGGFGGFGGGSSGGGGASGGW